MSAPRVVDALRHLGGTARAADLVAICGRDQLSKAVDSGLVLRLARGRYALPDCPDPWVTAAKLGGVVSHTSAAQHWGMAVLRRPERPHVTVARTRSRLRPVGAEVHWANLAPDETHSEVPVTSPLRTLVDCARSLRFGAALAIADSALREGLVGHVQIEEAAERIRGAGAARARRVLRAADPRAQSGLESALRAIYIAGHISGFEPQLPIRDAEFSAHVDLGDRDRMIVAEADSFEHHGHRSALAGDCRRYNEFGTRGWLVLRFAWEHVMFDPAWVDRTTRAAIALRTTRARAGSRVDAASANMPKSSLRPIR